MKEVKSIFKDSGKSRAIAAVIAALMAFSLLLTGCLPGEAEEPVPELTAKEQKIADTIWNNRSVWEPRCGRVRLACANGKYFLCCSYEQHADKAITEYFGATYIETTYRVDAANNTVREASFEEYNSLKNYGMVSSLSYDASGSQESRLNTIKRLVAGLDAD